MVTYSDQDDYDDDGEEDFEFDAVALDVCERLSEEDDPEVVLTVNEWLTKLTEPNGRGPNELNYLKLLRCMTANRRIGRPFRRPPPTGRLWPVHVYLLRPTRSFVGGGGSVTSDVLPAPLRHARSFRCWRTASCSRGSQTHDDDGDDDGDNDGDNNDDEEDDGNQRSQVVAKEETPGLVGNSSREGATTSEDEQPTTKGEVSNVDDVEHTKRDGHLAAGASAPTDLHDSCFD